MRSLSLAWVILLVGCLGGDDEPTLEMVNRLTPAPGSTFLSVGASEEHMFLGGSEGILVYALNDGHDMEMIASWVPDPLGRITSIHVRHPALYYFDHNGGHVVDISDPLALREVRRQPMFDVNAANMAATEESDLVFSLNTTSWDVSDPLDPVAVVSVGGVGGTTTMARDGDTLYMGAEPGIFAMDFSDPAAPQELGRSDALPRVLFYAGDGILYCGSGLRLPAGGGCQILDVSDPTMIEELGEPEGEELWMGADSMTRWGDWMWVMSTVDGSFTKRELYDISDPRRPRKHPGIWGIPPGALYASTNGRFFFVANESFLEVHSW